MRAADELVVEPRGGEEGGGGRDGPLGVREEEPDAEGAQVHADAPAPAGCDGQLPSPLVAPFFFFARGLVGFVGLDYCVYFLGGLVPRPGPTRPQWSHENPKGSTGKNESTACRQTGGMPAG